MVKERFSEQCGLTLDEKNILVSDRRFPGILRFYTNKLQVFCSEKQCPLLEGRELSFEMIVASSPEEIINSVKRESKREGSNLKAKIDFLQAEYCPFLRKA